MEENIVPSEGQLESGEAREADEQALDDATYEPRSFVEQTSDYQQAEDIQGNLVDATENAAKAAENEGAAPQSANAEISDGRVGKTIKDPLTGKGGEDQGGSAPGDSGDDEPVLAEGFGQSPPVGEGQIEKPSTNENPKHVPYTDIDGVEQLYRMGDQDVDSGQSVGGGLEAQGEASKDFDPQRLGPESLPQEKQLPVGMGPKGALFPGRGPGGKGPGGGSSSSGGGPPVNVPGGGKGKEPGAPKGVDQKAWGQNQRRLDVEGMKQGSKTTITDKETGITWTLGSDGIWRRQETDDEPAPAENPKEGDPIDGDFGMPYTGSGGGGEKPNPNEPQGGLDREAGKVFPVLPKGGGSGDSGGKTPGDKDGEDDSGKFLGDPDLTGGPDLGDPDFPDYYTPNVLEEAQKSKKSGSK